MLSEGYEERVSEIEDLLKCDDTCSGDVVKLLKEVTELMDAKKENENVTRKLILLNHEENCRAMPPAVLPDNFPQTPTHNDLVGL